MRRIGAVILLAAAVLSWPLTAATPTVKPEEVGFSTERLHRINDLVQALGFGLWAFEGKALIAESPKPESKARLGETP